MIPEKLKKQKHEMKPNRIATRFTNAEWQKILTLYEHQKQRSMCNSLSEFIRRAVLFSLGR